MALATGGALLLTLGTATGSQAATGTLTYVRADTGSTATIDNPSDQFCYFMSNALSAHNGTNSTATFYADSFCDPGQFLGAAQPGEGITFGSARTMSVRFG
ncbi:hypothetical protein AB0K09_07805 [Streptomyces sp. NPDC049577]|uniref:hypothetical protein n=1 Tax=Streptomyces sp. NPDC049577 TaxID=3155153 RepID=UPI003449CE79